MSKPAESIEVLSEINFDLSIKKSKKTTPLVFNLFSSKSLLKIGIFGLQKL